MHLDRPRCPCRRQQKGRTRTRHLAGLGIAERLLEVQHSPAALQALRRQDGVAGCLRQHAKGDLHARESIHVSQRLELRDTLVCIPAHLQ